MKLQIFLAFWAIKVTLATKDPEKAITCEPMKVDLCMSAQDNFYNTTGFPNFKGDRDQTDAGEQLKTWVPLLETQCAAELLLFLSVNISLIIEVIKNFQFPPVTQ